MAHSACRPMLYTMLLVLCIKNYAYILVMFYMKKKNYRKNGPELDDEEIKYSLLQQPSCLLKLSGYSYISVLYSYTRDAGFRLSRTVQQPVYKNL